MIRSGGPVNTLPAVDLHSLVGIIQITRRWQAKDAMKKKPAENICTLENMKKREIIMNSKTLESCMPSQCCS